MCWYFRKIGYNFLIGLVSGINFSRASHASWLALNQLDQPERELAGEAFFVGKRNEKRQIVVWRWY